MAGITPAAALADTYREVVEAHTKVVPGTRRFLPTFKEQ